jgi:phenylalanyl-tRNA synthetase alpha chain
VSVEITEASVAEAVDAALAAIAASDDLAALKLVKSAQLGEGSAIAGLSAAMRDVAPDQKAAAGKLVGQARARATEAFAAREAELFAVEDARRLAAEAVDVTALPSRRTTGARHPLSLLQELIGDVFVGMG